MINLHSTLKHNHPELFSKPYRPFAIGLLEQLLKAYPHIKRKEFKKHLRNICSHPLYLGNFIDGKHEHRVNIDLSTAQPLTEDCKQFAKTRLKSILKERRDAYIEKIGRTEVEALESLISQEGKAASHK